MSYPIACTWSSLVAMKPSDDEELLGWCDPTASLYSGGGSESQSSAEADGDLECLDFDIEAEEEEASRPILWGFLEMMMCVTASLGCKLCCAAMRFKKVVVGPRLLDRLYMIPVMTPLHVELPVYILHSTAVRQTIRLVSTDMAVWRSGKSRPLGVLAAPPWLRIGSTRRYAERVRLGILGTFIVTAIDMMPRCRFGDDVL